MEITVHNQNYIDTEFSQIKKNITKSQTYPIMSCYNIVLNHPIFVSFVLQTSTKSHIFGVEYESN